MAPIGGPPRRPPPTGVPAVGAKVIAFPKVDVPEIKEENPAPSSVSSVSPPLVAVEGFDPKASPHATSSLGISPEAGRGGGELQARLAFWPRDGSALPIKRAHAEDPGSVEDAHGGKIVHGRLIMITAADVRSKLKNVVRVTGDVTLQESVE